jgi:hypothetical protein
MYSNLVILDSVVGTLELPLRDFESANGSEFVGIGRSAPIAGPRDLPAVGPEVPQRVDVVGR